MPSVYCYILALPYRRELPNYNYNANYRGLEVQYSTTGVQYNRSTKRENCQFSQLVFFRLRAGIFGIRMLAIVVGMDIEVIDLLRLIC